MTMPSYRGNAKLKPRNTIIAFSQDEVNELKKCLSDPLYFIENYIYIVNLDQGLIKFSPRPYQRKVVELLEKERFLIIKFPRQGGKTSILSAYALVEALSKENYSILIAANKAKTATKIIRDIKRSFESLPPWLQEGVIEWNEMSVAFENGSRIMAVPTAEDSARGFSFNLVILDEFAFVDPGIAEEFFKSIYPTISSGVTTRMVIISTPKGLNHFYSMWVQAVEKKSGFVPLEIKWDEVPGRDQRFKEETIANFSEEYWKQEYESEFLGSSHTLIKSDKLKWMIRTIKDPIKEVEGVHFYEKPVPEHRYFISVDSSEGKGIDCNAFSIIDITARPFRVVATFKDADIQPLLFAEIIFRMALQFNEAFVLVELKSTGGEIVNSLFYDFEYGNLLAAENRGRSGQTLTGFKKNARGITTSKTTKAVGCTSLRLLIENDQLFIEDKDTLSELTTFVLHNRTYQAEGNADDDLVMSLVNFAWASGQKYFANLSDVDIKQILQDRMKEIEEALPPSGRVVDSTEDEVDESMRGWTKIGEASF